MDVWHHNRISVVAVVALTYKTWHEAIRTSDVRMILDDLDVSWRDLGLPV